MNKRGELAKQILLVLGTGVAITTAILLPGSAEMFKPLIKKFKTNKRNFVKSLKTMKRDRVVDFKEDGKFSNIVITEKGRAKLLRYNLDDMEIKKPKKWDKIWRVVTFDIPEKKKASRNALRSKLKELGFSQFHKSVFVYPYPCLDEIQFIEEIFNISPYVNFIEAKTIDNDEWLKEKFDLI